MLDIDWDVCYAALNAFHSGRQRWVMKAYFELLQRQHEDGQWKEQPTADCPRCGQSERRPTRMAMPRPGYYYFVLGANVFIQRLADFIAADYLLDYPTLDRMAQPGSL
jgi:hypothetical protein